MYKKVILYVVSIISVTLILLFVYPTMYRYDKLDQKWPVKIHRVTGETQVLTNNGWTELGNIQEAKTMSPKSPKNILAKSDFIDPSATTVKIGEFTISRLNIKGDVLTGEIINDTEKDIGAARLRVETYDDKENVLPKQPTESHFFSVGPKESKIFTIDIDAHAIRPPGFVNQVLAKYKISISYNDYQ